MKTLDQYIQLAAKDGSTRSGIVLGIRMALLGVEQLRSLSPAADPDEMVVFVETDRCLPDAMELVTGCRLGNRKLKFRDLGKMAATFANPRSGLGIRVAALEGTGLPAGIGDSEADREAALVRYYTSAAGSDLFTQTPVHVAVPAEETPGYHSDRIICGECGEGVSFGRIVHRGTRTLCLACAGESYYHPAETKSTAA